MSRPHSRFQARRRVLQTMLLSGVAGLLPLGAPAWAAPCAWPAWSDFVARHVSQDGRVIDLSVPDQRSTSEGQSYGLFFALVANDAALFERILGWTRDNLGQGDLGRHLPAWLWGRDDQGAWRVLDDNSASDSDMWIAYALIEAGRLWNRPAYTGTGMAMLKLIAAQEVARLPGLGPMLLPGRTGFAKPRKWLLNPSYLPLQLLARFAAVDAGGPWKAIIAGTRRMLHEAAPLGLVPDWIAWDGTRFAVDPSKGPVGSYDAIRAYLWAGMLDAAFPGRAAVLRDLQGPLRLLKAGGPFFEKVDTITGTGTGAVPVGFRAALLPYLGAQQAPALLAWQLQRIPPVGSADADRLPYYERTLILFGQGWYEQRYRFSADGRLSPAWRSAACSAGH